MKFFKLIVCTLLFAFMTLTSNAQAMQPLRLGVAGLTHDHIAFLMNRNNTGDIRIVGIYEPNTELAYSYAKKWKFDTSLIYTDLNKMLDAAKPEAVVAFGSVFDHLQVVKACAPRHIHVMVEKPLAVNEAHAKEMADLAKQNNIILLTDFETSWYPTTAKAYTLINDSSFVGNIKKVVIHDGHRGPKEIGCTKEFLNWLTDPELNGGGALVDFGCYGANIMTSLMHGQKPLSVTAVTRHYKPLVYPKVEDDATIIVDYPTSQCIIQASWNWPFSRKDMEIYGDKGYIITTDKNNMRIKNKESEPEQQKYISATDVDVYEDPFAYFINVVRGKIKVPEYGFYSLENNLMVVKILEAAKLSAKTGTTVKLQ
ncbi:Gfo/Idh/MocA family protein [Ferruginibacter albus]|uniref:Gfo/Idh/MocA family protein n=1 Tax=Ferruginibacter albus TaxID=2875540 RepID=UPI001CC61069|nr:Gfo/Idh/MocA family oxidoreductase [Ferruginibacter albus]UAY50797.1 Gfo/Idh/MocA family oxidoreductase [Ferruginibacter albus]